MASVLDIIKHYQQAIEKYSDDEGKVLRCIDKLFQLNVTVQHLQETGVGRTVNALRKEPGEIGQAARALVLKWKTMVAAEESDQEGDHRNDTSAQNGHGSGRESDDHMQQSRSMHDQYNNTKVTTPKSDHKEINGHHSGTKRKYHISEEEHHDAKKKSRHTSSSEDDHKKQTIVKTEKLSDSESSDDDSESSDSDSDSYTSESSQEEVKVKQEVKQEIKKEKKESPDRHKSSSSKHTHSNHDHKKNSSNSKAHDSDRHSHHKSSSKDLSRQPSEVSSKSSSHKHKSSHEKENNSEKRHKSYTSSDEKKESKSSRKHSSERHKSSSHKHDSSSDTHKSSTNKHSNKEHKSSSHTEKAPEKYKSSSEKDVTKHKSKESTTSSKEKHNSSSKEKSKERSSSSKERSSHSHSSDKKHSPSDDKSQNSDKSKHKSDDGSSKNKSKEKSSSSSSHKSKSSSSNKSKEDVPKKKSKLSNSEDSGEDGIDCGSGASFAEALGMISPTKPKKKSSQIRDGNSPNNSFNNDLTPAALLAPSAKLAPLPLLEISALPEISPNYKPRPPPKLLPNFTDEDAISAGISSKNQRTKVYSGNKVVGKITSLYEMCVHVLQEHIDALEYTGGVPYEILKPVVDRATPQQLWLLEHYNPYLMEDTDHLWQKFCEKNFRNKRRQELETWREMYIRCQEEQESKLKSLTANIRLTQEAKKAPIKQTKMAYVDTVVKPPRNIARKQALHGTAHASTASPASRVASLSTTPGVLKGGSPRPPPAASVSASSFNKPKKAPLMQKALQFMRGRKR